jgi:hypothetical protein
VSQFQHHIGGHIKEDEMVGACGMYGEELDIDGRVTLKCILM